MKRFQIKNTNLTFYLLCRSDYIDENDKDIEKYSSLLDKTSYGRDGFIIANLFPQELFEVFDVKDASWDFALPQEWVHEQLKRNPSFDTHRWVWIYSRSDSFGKPFNYTAVLWPRLMQYILDYLVITDSEDMETERHGDIDTIIIPRISFTEFVHKEK